jgi:hypothetical protein
MGRFYEKEEAKAHYRFRRVGGVSHEFNAVEVTKDQGGSQTKR